MINCKETDKLITSDEYPYLSWMKRLEVKLHLLMCSHCSRVVRQLKSLKESARELWVISDRTEPGQETETLESRLLHHLSSKP